MPPTHTITIPVRYDECDMYGHVNHANYLRYMQEGAFAASAAVGYDVKRYEELGHYWLVHESDVEYVAPLRYGDTVEVTTWVANFRRVRSRRAYELRRAGDGQLVARAHTDWVYLDRERQRPAPVPQEMIEAFRPDYEEQDPVSRRRFPTPPSPPPGQFTQRRRVQWSDVDPTGHVNNAVYVSYLEDCAVRDAASRGWSMARMMDEGGFGIVARRYRIRYRQQALLGDELEVATWISDVKRATAVRHYTIHRLSDGELLTRARALWVWVDSESGRPTRIPEQFAADFAPNIV
ncbi:MAG TPA: thioesterase family protein [Candidatus Sulfomarinibacteraceae bacterium]|nr:thioesterase family protein [Candidatus Sulfomarinibacteraceae bacterium]